MRMMMRAMVTACATCLLITLVFPLNGPAKSDGVFDDSDRWGCVVCESDFMEALVNQINRICLEHECESNTVSNVVTLY